MLIEPLTVSLSNDRECLYDTKKWFLLTQIMILYAKKCISGSISKPDNGLTCIFCSWYIPWSRPLKMSWTVHLKAPKNRWNKDKARIEQSIYPPSSPALKLLFIIRTVLLRWKCDSY